MLIACPSCLQLNRIPDNRLSDKPNCGQCKRALFSGQVVQLTHDNFHRLVERSELPVIVDFWANWCGPCKSFAPIFSQAAKELEPAMRFAKLDTDQESALASRFAIRSIPTLIIFKEGQIVARQSGALPKSALYQWIQSHS